MTDYHCTRSDGYRRCDQPATHRLLVNGLPAQGGGYVCEKHGRVVVEEYAPHGGLLGVWTMEPLEAQP